MSDNENVKRLVNINHRANWLFEKMPDFLRNHILSYRGVDGKAPKDVYGKITDAPQDTVNLLLNTKLKSTFDGKEYPLRDYLVINNQRLNDARVRDQTREVEIAHLTSKVEALAQAVKAKEG